MEEIIDRSGMKVEHLISKTIHKGTKMILHELYKLHEFPNLPTILVAENRVWYVMTYPMGALNSEIAGKPYNIPLAKSIRQWLNGTQFDWVLDVAFSKLASACPEWKYFVNSPQFEHLKTPAYIFHPHSPTQTSQWNNYNRLSHPMRRLTSAMELFSGEIESEDEDSD